MRIKCFSEARGVFEEGQISFEPQIHCFGGGGGGGGGGGDSRSEADRSYEDDFGFSSDLADKYSGSAADVGGRDNNGGDDRPAPAPAPAPSPSAMDTAIANALANIDTASLADISTPMVGGAFVDPTTGFGIMQDIPGPAMQSAIDVAQLATPGLYGSQATTGDSFEDLLGDSMDSLFGFYETTPVPRGSESNAFGPLELEDLQQGINMRQAMPGTGIDEILGLQARLDQGARIARQEEQARRNQILGNEFIAGPDPGPSPAPSFDMDSAITQQDYNNLQGGRSVIEQILAERAGAFPGPSPGMTAGGVDTRSFAEKVAAGEIPEDVFVYGASAPSGDEILTFGLDTSDTRSFAEKVAAGEIPEDIFVYGASAPSGDEILTFGLDTSDTRSFAEKVAAAPQTQQFQELQTTNISLMDQLEDLQQGINMRQAEFDALSARYDGLAPLATFNIVPELNTQLDDLNSQLAGKQDEILGLQTRLDDTFKQFTDLQGQYGAQSDQLTALDEQFGLSQQQIQDQAARIAEQEEAARRNRILGIAGVSPVASSAMTQTAPAPRPSANRFEGEVVPGFGASIDRAIGDFMGETYGGRTEQLPDGTINKELFTDLGDFVSRRDRNARNPGNIGVGSGAALGATSNRNFQSADFLSGYSPVAQQRMQEGYLADYGIELPNIEVFGKNYPISPLAAGVNAIANPEYTMTQALRQGASPVYGTLPGQEGSILGATSPSGDIVYSNAPFGDSLAALKGTFGFGPGLDPNMEAAYARQRELDDAERARNDSGDQAAPPALTLPDPVTQECPEGYTRDGSGICVYVGQPRVGVTPYTPMAPVEFSYTGLPSLAPRTLRPTAPNLSFLNRR
jgi:hypothetical protein